MIKTVGLEGGEATAITGHGSRSKVTWVVTLRLETDKTERQAQSLRNTLDAGTKPPVLSKLVCELNHAFFQEIHRST
ncbi:hypothetical protein BaRGS_00030648 [Batillaria attramentaria]|uniref:Uncharacterized protein n=1 Tax=Batillaria attramentaria TaxID=370345 RepID=A0ABD0JTB6_9CAEN